MKTIEKYGLAIIEQRRLMVTREEDHEVYLLPGGRPEKDETPEQTLVREVREELGAGIDPASISLIGVYQDVAAGRADAMLRLHLYSARLLDKPRPCGEVLELIWFSASDERDRLSPILKNKVVPDLVARGML